METEEHRTHPGGEGEVQAVDDAGDEDVSQLPLVGQPAGNHPVLQASGKIPRVSCGTSLGLGNPVAQGTCSSCISRQLGGRHASGDAP